MAQMSDLELSITKDGLMHHLEKLQSLASKHGDNRQVGSDGHEETLDYITSFMSSYGYKVHKQEFEVVRVDVPHHTMSVKHEDGSTQDYNVNIMHNSPSTKEGGLHAHLVHMDEGCTRQQGTSENENEADGPWIALVKRGGCSFTDKQKVAHEDGASAVLVYDSNADEEEFEGQVDDQGQQNEQQLPPIGAISMDTGLKLLKLGKTLVNLAMEVKTTQAKTYNVIAETEGGDHENVVMIGAHTDSVAQGPGINDDGSGVTTLLELAAHIQQRKIKNAVRFAFWSAEELGIIGSHNYMKGLSDEEKKKIKVYLNIDMIGSPNHVNMIYDGDGNESEETGLAIPAGNAPIEKLFEKYFEQNHEKHEVVGLQYISRSDAGPFFEAGIPFGGLTTGFEFIKTKAEVKDYGGQAGVAHDPCYHQACDTIKNIDPDALLLHARAYARAIDEYSQPTASVDNAQNTKHRADDEEA
ncbi:hypothetical protein BC940DRAFT_319732 [Gongronella butleri]|nr:hypothetical protein BC940DRAFT_319732 [Gongronella butleri]